MTQENKKLLLKDLCARLLYGVIGKYSWKGREPYNRELTGNLYDELKSSWNSTGDSEFFPYLRSMSSMTEEEREEYSSFVLRESDGYLTNGLPDYTGKHYVYIDNVNVFINWLLKNHFDYHGLIEKGLAIEAPDGMYNLNREI